MTYSEGTACIRDFKNLGMHTDLDAAKPYYYSLIARAASTYDFLCTVPDCYRLFDGHFVKPNLTNQKKILLTLGLKRAYDEFMLHPPYIYSVDWFHRVAACLLNEIGRVYITSHGIFHADQGDFRLYECLKGKENDDFVVTVSYKDVLCRMELYCDWLNDERRKLQAGDEKGIYELSMQACVKFLEILPFYQGNKLVAILLMNTLQYEFGALPIGIDMNCMNQMTAYLKQGSPVLRNEFPRLFYTVVQQTVQEAIDVYQEIIFSKYPPVRSKTKMKPYTLFTAVFDSRPSVINKECLSAEHRKLMSSEIAQKLYRLVLLNGRADIGDYALWMNVTMEEVRKWMKILERNNLVICNHSLHRNSNANVLYERIVPLVKKKVSKYKFLSTSDEP